MNDKNMEAFHDLVKKARGMLITPQLLKGAFIIGASGGTGVFVARDERTGSGRVLPFTQSAGPVLACRSVARPLRSFLWR